MRASVGAATAAASLLPGAPWPRVRRRQRRRRRTPAPPAVATLLLAVAAATAVAAAAAPPERPAAEAAVTTVESAAALPPSAYAVAAARDAAARARLRDDRLRSPAPVGAPSSPYSAAASAAMAANVAVADEAALPAYPAPSSGLLYDGSYAALAYAGVSLVGAVAAMCAVGGGLLGLWADGAALAAGDGEEEGLWEGPDGGLGGDDWSDGEEDEEASDCDTDASVDEEAAVGGAGRRSVATADPESLCVPPDDYASPAAIYAAAGFVGTPAAGRAGMLGVSELALDAVAAAAGGGLAATAARCRRRRSSRFGGRRLGAGGAVPATKDLDVSSMALA